MCVGNICKMNRITADDVFIQSRHFLSKQTVTERHGVYFYMHILVYRFLHLKFAFLFYLKY